MTNKKTAFVVVFLQTGGTDYACANTLADAKKAAMDMMKDNLNKFDADYRNDLRKALERGDYEAAIEIWNSNCEESILIRAGLLYE